MMYYPEKFVGKTIKMNGNYSEYVDEATGKRYHACIIKDATACCSQGVEFELTADYKYPDNYPKEDAEFAVSYLEDNGKVDWNEQAVKAAKNYLEFSSFSREGLIDQLCSEYGDQYTREQAEYAVDQVGY